MLFYHVHLCLSKSKCTSCFALLKFLLSKSHDPSDYWNLHNEPSKKILKVKKFFSLKADGDLFNFVCSARTRKQTPEIKWTTGKNIHTYCIAYYCTSMHYKFFSCYYREAIWLNTPSQKSLTHHLIMTCEHSRHCPWAAATIAS